MADNNSEHKIDLVQEQLSALQQTVRDITRPSAVPSAPCQVSSTPGFEGQSSFNRETRLARDAAYSTVILQEPNDDVSAALATLKHSLDKNNQTNAQAKVTESSEQPLPVNFVVAVVKKVKGRHSQRQDNKYILIISTTAFLPRQSCLVRLFAGGIALPVDLFSIRSNSSWFTYVTVWAAVFYHP